jgi:alkaline phosphatase D
MHRDLMILKNQLKIDVYLSIMKWLSSIVVICITIAMPLFVQGQPSTTYPNDRSVLDSTIQPFYHGVASGDPLNDRVIIWTRVTTDLPSVEVKWKMATDVNMQQVVAQGTTTTDASRDYTVKVDVTGLQPGVHYYYEFEALGRLSQRGRTKTMPTGDVSSLRLALVSCSNYMFGYFNAYDVLKDRNDIDMVFHTGDYIYEDGFRPGGVDTIRRRVFPEIEAFDLSSYRLRYSWYRLDSSLRNLHQQYPFVVVWDDHEFANDAFADTSSSHNPATQGSWAVRKANAIRVFKEWIPMREDTSRTNIINFTQNVGALADIIYTENRIERSEFDNLQQGIDLTFQLETLPYDTPNRTMHGKRQMDWMCEQLKQSQARWKILANQVVFASYIYRFPALGGIPAHQLQGWDANPLDRKRVIDTIVYNDINNVVILSGDIHQAIAFDIPGGVVPYNPTTGDGSVAVEFVCDAVSAGDVLPNNESYMYQNNANLKYFKAKSQGYSIIDITPNSVCCDFWQIDSLAAVSRSETFLATFCTIKDQNRLKSYLGPTFTPRTFTPLVPYAPRNQGLPVGIKYNQQQVELIGIYPNPAADYIRFQYFMKEADALKVEVYNLQGKMVESLDYGIRTRGLNEDALSVSKLPNAEYIVVFRTGNQVTSRKFVKQQ